MATKASMIKDALHAYGIRLKRKGSYDREFVAASKAMDRVKDRVEKATKAKEANDAELTEFASIVTSLGGELPEIETDGPAEDETVSTDTEDESVIPDNSVAAPVENESTDETDDSTEAPAKVRRGGRFAKS
jgi:hypothetical protein